MTTRDVEFWLDNPNALLDEKYIRDIWPSDSMTFERKLNAITRTIIVMTLVGAVFVRRRTTAIMASGVLATASLAVLHYLKGPDAQKESMTEGFMNTGIGKQIKQTLLQAEGAEGCQRLETSGMGLKHVADRPIGQQQQQQQQLELDSEMRRRRRKLNAEVYAKNPFRNVMVPDYGTPSVEHPEIEEDEYEDIYDSVKDNVVQEFENEDDIEKEEVHSKLFQSLGDSYVFENSMRNYATNPSRTAAGNQDEFANYCYGEMCSIKEQGIHPP